MLEDSVERIADGGDTLQADLTLASHRSPRYTSMMQRRADEKREFRERAGLTSRGTIHKDLSKDPGLRFEENPEVSSLSLLRERRRADNLNLGKQCEANVGVHQYGMRRLLLREDARFRHLANQSPGKTCKQLSQER